MLVGLNDSCQAFWLNLSAKGSFFPSLAIFLFLPWFARPVCAASHTSTPSASNFLCVSVHQGAETQSDTAAQWAQVPDTRLRRVSKAQVWLLCPRVADPDHQAERDTQAERVRERGTDVCPLNKSQSQHQTWEADVLVFSTGLLTEWKWIWIGRHPLSEMWI